MVWVAFKFECPPHRAEHLKAAFERSLIASKAEEIVQPQLNKFDPWTAEPAYYETTSGIFYGVADIVQCCDAELIANRDLIGMWESPDAARYEKIHLRKGMTATFD